MKLKPLVRHRISRGRRDFNPELMKRYQLTLLYGGGAALSAFILLCSVLAVWMAASDYNAAARAGFLTQESRLLVSMTGASAVLKRGTGYAEGVWDRQALPSPALREQYLSNHGQLGIIQDSGRRVYAVATEVSDARPAASFLPLLAMVEKQLKSSIVLTRTPELSANTYFLSVQGISWPRCSGREAATRYRCPACPMRSDCSRRPGQTSSASRRPRRSIPKPRRRT